MPDHRPLIEIDQVHRIRGGKPVLRGVSFAVKKGEFFSIVGPSGCGKTTLLRLLAGLDAADQGQIRLDGIPIEKIPQQSQKLLLVFQNYALFPHMTVADNVAFGLKIRGDNKATIGEKVKHYLDIVQLDGFAQRYPHQLSGGQQQRVAIARALAPEPVAVLFDEPLGALDQKLRRQMQFELKSLQRKLDTTFVYVTHDQEEALTLSDRIALMHDGKLEQVGSPKNLYLDPASPFAAKFIGDNNALDGHIEAGSLTLNGDSQSSKMSRGDLPKGKVTIFLRPEHIHLSLHASPPSANALEFPCKVRFQQFVGREKLISVNLAGQTLMAKAGADAEMPINQTIFCSWNTQHMRVFPSQGGH